MYPKQAERFVHNLHPVLIPGCRLCRDRLRVEQAYSKNRYTMRVRFPRLLTAMQWVAVLSKGEAENGLMTYFAGGVHAGEAVNHFGGSRAVIEAAYRRRPDRSKL